MTRAAWTFGLLYDLGEYPAMLAGHDRVAGEVWTFRGRDLPRVLEILDRIEGTNQPGQTNEYDRVEISVRIQGTSGEVTAQTYVYSRPGELERYGRRVGESLELSGARYVIWPIGSPWN